MSDIAEHVALAEHVSLAEHLSAVFGTAGLPTSEDTVAVCVSGMTRTLFAHAVSQSLREHVLSAIHRDGFASQLFMTVVGDWAASAAVASATEQQIWGLYAPQGLRLLQDVGWPAYERSMKSCRVPRPRKVAPPHLQGLVLQWLGVASCYAQVEEAEATRRQRYGWLLRLRTDLVYYGDLPSLRNLPKSAVYVPAAGMTIDSDWRCMNDHIFLCPRALCRPYFMQSELRTSRHCRSTETSGEDAGIINVGTCKSNTPHDRCMLYAHRDGAELTLGSLVRDGPPDRPFTLPPGMRSGRARLHATHFYLFYADAPPVVRDGAASCGLIKEIKWGYSIARGNESHGGVNCNSRWNEWMSHDLRGPSRSLLRALNASEPERLQWRQRCEAAARTWAYPGTFSRNGCC